METMHSASAEEIRSQLQELTQGLWYTSESEYPLEIVQFDLGTSGEITPEQVLALSGNPGNSQVEVVELTYFFRHVAKPVTGSPQNNNSAQGFQNLQAFLEKQLHNVKVYRIGQRTISAYILGKVNDQTLLGLKTTVVET